MKAKELKDLVKNNNMCAWSVALVNKVPMTNKQAKSLYYMVSGIGKVDTMEIIEATNFKPQDFSIELHFSGEKCAVSGELVWQAYVEKCGKINEAVVRAEGC